MFVCLLTVLGNTQVYVPSQDEDLSKLIQILASRERTLNTPQQQKVADYLAVIVEMGNSLGTLQHGCTYSLCLCSGSVEHVVIHIHYNKQGYMSTPQHPQPSHDHKYHSLSSMHASNPFFLLGLDVYQLSKDGRWQDISQSKAWVCGYVFVDVHES